MVERHQLDTYKANRFYFITEFGLVMQIDHSDLVSMRETIVELMHKEPNKTGYIGYIDIKGNLRGSLLLRYHDLKVRTKLFDFFRKYTAIPILENVARTIQTNLKS